jgi:bifunctional DNA-binding transcriptional regulator/antitoxin component of YhaV-PrlF toxin-antitoxin module
MLQSENRVQLPTEVRQHFRLESGNFLRIKIQQANSHSTFREEFFAKLSTDGRITVPWEVRWKIEAKPGQIMRLFLYPED